MENLRYTFIELTHLYQSFNQLFLTLFVKNSGLGGGGKSSFKLDNKLNLFTFIIKDYMNMQIHSNVNKSLWIVNMNSWDDNKEMHKSC